MARSSMKVFAVGLVTCLLLISGGLYAQVAQHAMHHAHHQAATHGTPLCAWMCAAGEIHAGFGYDLGNEIGLVSSLDSSLPSLPLLRHSSEHSSRAPPLPHT